MIAQAFLASTAIILLSFVSEDAATISSSLSIFGGPLSWPLGFATCFAGIWLGDLSLYWLARYLGKPVLQSRWVARFVDASTIERCQEKFNERGSLTLLATYLPGGGAPLDARGSICSRHRVRGAFVDRRSFRNRGASRRPRIDLVLFHPRQNRRDCFHGAPCRRCDFASRKSRSCPGIH
ncbi:MAG: hypothetical protein DMF09_13845 [Verrucomicrobia bacterium]|nr:MAG: hypothetical protein DMF09_13845 [Verrucomicrobiota bacterium]